jgi:hypothetical protein
MPPPAKKATGPTEKRGRGRPRKPDAKSNAERQAAWRARHGPRSKSVTVTKNILPSINAHDALVRECETLRNELAQARRKLAMASRKPSALAPSVAAVLDRPPRPEDADAGERRIQLTMNGSRFFALERLVAHFRLSRRAVIERMIDWADETVSRSLYDDEAAFNRYIDRNEK